MRPPLAFRPRIANHDNTSETEIDRRGPGAPSLLVGTASVGISGD